MQGFLMRRPATHKVDGSEDHRRAGRLLNCLPATESGVTQVAITPLLTSRFT